MRLRDYDAGERPFFYPGALSLLAGARNQQREGYRMKRYLRLIAGVWVMGMAACGTGRTPDPPSAPAAEEEPRFEPRIGLGQPAPAPQVLLRPKASSRPAAQPPLFVIDGVAQEHAPPDSLHAEIVEISIVRGPAAVEQYGSRAANGAIVITTRREREP